MYQYKGVLQPNDVIHTLKQYDALIFPSHYDGKYNNELVTNGDNGFLCSTFDPNEYVEAIKVLLLNKTILKRMAEKSYEKSGEFSVGKARVLLNQYVAISKS